MGRSPAARARSAASAWARASSGSKRMKQLRSPAWRSMRSTQAAVTSREGERAGADALRRLAEGELGRRGHRGAPPSGLARAPSPRAGAGGVAGPGASFGPGAGGHRRGEPAQRRRHLGRLGVEAGPVGEGREGRLRVGEEAGHARRVAVVELRVLGRADELREGRGAHLGRLVHGWPALGSKVRQAYPIAAGRSRRTRPGCRAGRAFGGGAANLRGRQRRTRRRMCGRGSSGAAGSSSAAPRRSSTSSPPGAPRSTPSTGRWCANRIGSAWRHPTTRPSPRSSRAASRTPSAAGRTRTLATAQGKPRRRRKRRNGPASALGARTPLRPLCRTARPLSKARPPGGLASPLPTRTAAGP